MGFFDFLHNKKKSPNTHLHSALEDSPSSTFVPEKPNDIEHTSRLSENIIQSNSSNDNIITLNGSKIENSVPVYQMDPRRDEKQRETICIDKGYHLVLAPAGCGKTDILAERVYRALCNGVDVEDMLCLTFTNRASRGMRSRINKVVGDKARELFIGNTHRFCSKFVFENNIISQSSSIMDEDDVLSVINSLSDFVMIDEHDKSDVASLDYNIHKRLTAVLQVQHLMKQYRLGHPQSVVLSKESDFADTERTVRFFSPQMFATLCREAGLPISIGSLL